MSGILTVLLGPWEWRWEISTVLGVAGLIYIGGWLRLRRKGYKRLAGYKPLLTYLAGLFTIAVALMSPIHTLQALIFFIHMFQHQLLIYLAAPLILAGRALPFIMWGLPAPLRRAIGAILTPDGWMRRVLREITYPPLAFALSTSILWLWHIPTAYNAAMSDLLIHDFQHLCFFGLGLLYWWALIGSPPQRAWLTSNAGRGLYLVLHGVQSGILGALIAFSDRVLYEKYLLLPRVCGVSTHYYLLATRLCSVPALVDQQIAGTLMWFPGPLIFGLAAAFLMREE